MTANGSQLKQRLGKRAKARGMAFFGIADLSEAREFISEQGGKFLSKYPLALSFGYRLLDSIVDEVKQHKNRVVAGHYWYYLYHILNRYIDYTSLELSSLLQDAGYEAFIIPNSYTSDRARLASLFSHKLAAHLAGHGWIGKSALLITPEYGPRVRWGTVLTNASVIAADRPFQGERCVSCSLCVDRCPVQAFTGLPFDSSKSRSHIFAAEKCDEYLIPTPSGDMSRLHCGICVSVCPYGQSRR